jgi:hypothetical protein
MNLKTCMCATVTVVFLALPTWSNASTYSLFATLDGSQEVPANASLGTGTGSMTYDDVTKLLSWDISFSGLSAGATASHFHGPAAPGVSAGVQIPISLGNSSGMTSGNLIGTATLASTQEADLLSNLWYINIHTSLFPGGEIRGQVQVVPLPAAVWLLGSGLLGLAGLMRRRVD